MHAPDDGTSPMQSLMRRTMLPWEYRHLRAVASVRFAAGGFTLALGLVLLSLGRQAETSQDRRKCYRFAAWFLAVAPLQFFGGYMEMKMARSAPPGT
jgi:low temperature requirement protein LtrA